MIKDTITDEKVHIWLFITKLLFLPILANAQEIEEKIIVIDSVNKEKKNLRHSFWVWIYQNL